MSYIQEIKNLIEELNQASALYYNTGTSFLTDAEFDSKLKQLETMEKVSGIHLSNSPTQRVGAEVLENIPKIQFALSSPPMLSLAKVHSQKEIDDFINGQEVLRMIKIDGLSVRICYEEGRLAWASTRGNGVVGSDITPHVTHFLNIPLIIPHKGRYIIDGEAVIKIPHFEAIKTENPIYKNPRNLAAGTLNLLDTSEVATRGMSFIAWDVIEGDDEPFLNERLENAENFGFETVYYSLDATNEEVLQMANMLGIPCDGVVWKYNDMEYGHSLGGTSHHFNSGVAWKPQDEVAQTRLLSIEWSMGRTGQLTPVAIFEPVELEGTEVSRASLHNLTIMNDILGDTPYIGQELDIYKANQIIPQVLQAVKYNWLKTPIVEKLCIPTICPICGGPLERVTEVVSETLMCNNTACPGKLINRLEHFVGKKGLDIKGLSKATLEKLVDWGWVSEFSDLYYLSAHRAEWIAQPGFGEKSVDNILNAIEGSRATTLTSFIAAIGIPHIGNSLAKELCKYIDSYEDFREKINSKFDFTIIDGIANEKLYAILNYDYAEADKVANEMLSWTTSAQTTTNNSLEGYTIVITGKLETFKNRDAFINLIIEHGGKVTSSISKNTSILINNDVDSTSSKNLTAKKLNIPIISEKEFLEKYLTL